MTPLVLLGAVVAGWIVQMLLTYRQTATFNRAVRDLNRQGTVAVGTGGTRYRGGRVFVAIAGDDQDHVVRAVALSGWTTFARPQTLPAVSGLALSRLRRESAIDGIPPPQRLALREAARTLHDHTAAAA